MQRLDITRHYNIHIYIVLIKTNSIFIYKSLDGVRRPRNVILFNEIISYDWVCSYTIQIIRPMYAQFLIKYLFLLLIRNIMFMYFSIIIFIRN